MIVIRVGRGFVSESLFFVNILGVLLEILSDPAKKSSNRMNRSLLNEN